MEQIIGDNNEPVLETPIKMSEMDTRKLFQSNLYKVVSMYDTVDSDTYYQTAIIKHNDTKYTMYISSIDRDIHFRKLDYDEVVGSTAMNVMYRYKAAHLIVRKHETIDGCKTNLEGLIAHNGFEVVPPIYLRINPVNKDFIICKLPDKPNGDDGDTHLRDYSGKIKKEFSGSSSLDETLTTIGDGPFAVYINSNHFKVGKDEPWTTVYMAKDSKIYKLLDCPTSSYQSMRVIISDLLIVRDIGLIEKFSLSDLIKEATLISRG